MTSALPSRGRAAKLVDERGIPAHLKCSSCQNPLFNASQTPHGCRLCQTCVEKLPAQEKVPCPGTTEACRDKEEDTTVSQSLCIPDTATRREIGKLNVFCPNKQEGCGAQFPWREVETHLSSCEFEKVECDMCGKEQLKRDLVAHRNNDCSQRRVQCKDCGVQVVALLMESEHKNLRSSTCCRQYKSSCPHCGQGDNKMSHADYMSHLSMCPQKPTACKFAHLGCPVVEAATKLPAHYEEAASEHLEMIDNQLRRTAQTSASATAPATVAAASSPSSGSGREAVELQKKVLNIFQKFKDLQPNVATWAQTTLELEELMKAFGGPTGFKTLLKVMDDKLRQLEAAERAAGGGTSGAATSAASESARMLDKMKTIELRFDALELTSFDGCLTWKLTGVADKRRDAKSGASVSVFSPPFFSKRYGYMFRVRLFLNGIDAGEGNYASVHLVLMQSEYDDVLDWPLVADVTFRLVHPRNRSEDIVSKATLDAARPSSVDDVTINVGVSRFAKLSILEEKFIRNDCIYIETEVEPRPADGSRRGRRR